MFKRNAIQILIPALAILALACGTGKNDHDHHEDSAEWKEMDDFHAIMAETFHPYKDSANLEPAKSRATELARAAEEWAMAKLPSKVDNEGMKEKLQQLEQETAALVQAVSADEGVGEQLTKVHDLFHEIQESWYGGGEGAHEGHH